jgi:hypothetical protein
MGGLLIWRINTAKALWTLRLIIARGDNMTREDLIKHWDVICAFKDGAEVEVFCVEEKSSEWIIDRKPTFEALYLYRIKPTKPSIDWSPVHPDFKWLAVDDDDLGILHQSKPQPTSYGMWSSSGHKTAAMAFASYKAGTCDWEDSLVERPEGE